MQPKEIAEELSETIASIRSSLREIGSFYHVEIDTARSGDAARLEQLAPQRAENDARVAALASQLGSMADSAAALKAAGSDAGRFAQAVADVESEMRSVLALAQRSRESTESLKQCLLDGLQLLALARQAYERYERRPPLRGALVDREG